MQHMVFIWALAFISFIWLFYPAFEPGDINESDFYADKCGMYIHA